MKTMVPSDKLARYRQYNAGRIARAVRLNQRKSEIIFTLVPYLLHRNQPDLPGYVADPACPRGIIAYDSASAKSSRLFQQLFPSARAGGSKKAPRPTRPCAIHSLKTIGSMGTIAQSEKSDCDFWVSVDYGQLGSGGLQLLQQKCGAIEAWAEAMGVETHFFLMDIAQTRSNSFTPPVADKAAACEQKVLLKDELFRTHILVAGKPLLWWLIPPGLNEEQYRIEVLRLDREQSINRADFVDLGCITGIPPGEILDACLWQMNKALASPFKSVIKFAYLELLLQQEGDGVHFFSDKVKRLVTYPEKLGPGEASLAPEQIDPYLLLAREVTTFYENSATSLTRQWADLIRECFFLKTLEDLKGPASKVSGPHNNLREIMEQMTAWDILPKDRQRFLNFRHWQNQEKQAFAGRVNEYLLQTYRRLSRSTRGGDLAA
ncbi:class I adenylate cyclase [Desulfurivibrio sp. C05AmB]|uniref:class I adenylate cyclase n=1 Tax=Desulfurivibrio sp. C05AmB TaxID=3374371 RepID=UPI00376F10A4